MFRGNRKVLSAIILAGIVLLFIMCFSPAQAALETIQIMVDKDIFIDAKDIYNYYSFSSGGSTVYALYIGWTGSTYGQASTAMGFDLSGTNLDDLPVVSIKLAFYRNYCSGDMNLTVTETEDDDWSNSNSSGFPTLIDAEQVVSQTMNSGSGFFRTVNIKDYVIEQYSEGDTYLTLLLTSESTSYCACVYAKESSLDAYLEIIYGYPAAELSAAEDLTEDNIADTDISLELTDCSFSTDTLTTDMFTLDAISASNGVSIDEVTYVDETHATLRLNASGDPDIQLEMSVIIAGEIMSTGSALESTTLGLHAYYEITQGGSYDLSMMGDTPDIRVYTTEHVTFTQSSPESKEDCIINNLVSGVDLEIAGINVNNDVSGSWAGIDFQGTGNTLTLTGENVIATYNDPVLRVTDDAALTIGGTGSLLAAARVDSAAIGSGKSETLGDIIIDGGTIEAVCINDGGAAIGGGELGSSTGTITINGGTITATGGTNAAGIGGGYNGGITSITINGGTITAIGGEEGAGIGTGSYADITSITVNGGTITARGGNANAAGIGTGYDGEMDTISITGGTVTAGYTGGGVGIGAGNSGVVDMITISGGVIYARWGGESDSAIGRDSYSDVNKIYITGGLVFADGYDQYCDDIGYGKEHLYAKDLDVQISGSAVVFLRNNKLADSADGITLPLYDSETITDHQAYGFTVPDDWSGTAYAYIPSSFPVTGISVMPESARMNLSIAETLELTAEVFPFYADNGAYSFESSDPGVATVDETGLVTPVGVGTAVITATSEDGGYTDTCTITVYIGASGVVLEPSTATLYLDGAAGLDTVQLTSTVTPENAEDKTISYTSSAAGVAGVDNEGTVTAVSSGTAKITVTASDGGYTDTCIITVHQCALGMSVSPDTAELVLGDNDTTNDTAVLTATFTPSDAYDQTVAWESSDTGVATVDASGLVTAQAAGSATITATANDGGYTAEVTIAVLQSATGVTLETHEAELMLGDADTSNDSITLLAAISPEDATDKGLVWSSSDESVATVDANGLVTAVNYGTAAITVETADGMQSDSCKITVYQSATGITVSPTFCFIRLDWYSEAYESWQLTATVLPEGANQAVSWESSDPTVATVNATGFVTGHIAGTITITVTSEDGGFSATTDVVVEQGATSVTVLPEEATLVLGDEDLDNDKADLSIEVLPDNARDKTVSFQNSNSNVVSIDGYTVTAIKAGTAVITVIADGGRTDTCTITVLQAVTSISLNETEAALALDDGNAGNDTLQLVATIEPANTSDKTVTWESSDPEIATVSDDGLVTAQKAGTAEITAAAAIGGKTASCLVTVTQSVTELSISQSSALLVLGDEDTGNDEITLEATIVPSDANEQEITWESSDTSVATVDSQGKVVAVKKGSAVITATSVDGDYEAACSVTVEHRLMLQGSCINGKVCLGNCITITPSLGGGKWTYDSDMVSCQGNTFTPLKAGTTVVAYTLDDKGKNANLLQTLLAFLFPCAAADNVEEAEFTITTEALTLTSSLPDGRALLSNIFTLTPNFEGGTWEYDANYLTRSGYEFTTRLEGTVTVTYTYEMQTIQYRLTIYAQPQTGDSTPPWSLYAGLLLLSIVCLPVLIHNKRTAR